MLVPGGQLFLSSPYCWNEEKNDPLLETENTDPHTFVIQLLIGQRAPEMALDYHIIFEKNEILWRLRKRGSLEFTYYVRYDYRGKSREQICR